MNWTYCHEKLPPTKPGYLPRHPVFVAVAEFGQEPQLAVAFCWISPLQPDSPQWYLDPDFYGLDVPVHVSGEVITWMEIPELPKLEPLMERLKRMNEDDGA